MKKINLVLVACAFMVSTGGAFAQDGKKEAEKENDKKFEQKKRNDAEFVVDALDNGLFEVKASELAKNKATSARVKQLALEMGSERSKANSDLQATAKKKSIVLPDKLSDRNQEKLDKLSKTSSADFDKEFADMMVGVHRDDVNIFEEQSTKGTDSELKTWAGEKLPGLKKHLEMAKSIYEGITAK